jgi:hypothetical protein
LCDCYDPKKICLRAVIEKKGSNLEAMKSDDAAIATDWNVALAGRYQRKSGLKAVKKMKNIVFEFTSIAGKSSTLKNALSGG